MNTWCDIIIDFDREFGVECNQVSENVWHFEKSHEDLDFTTAFSISEEISEGVLFTVCDEMRIPKSFFISKYKLNQHYPVPQPID